MIKPLNKYNNYVATFRGLDKKDLIILNWESYRVNYYKSKSFIKRHSKNPKLRT